MSKESEAALKKLCEDACHLESELQALCQEFPDVLGDLQAILDEGGKHIHLLSALIEPENEGENNE